MTTVATDRQERIRRTLEHLRDGTTDESESVLSFGPRDFTDPDLAERERDLIFGTVPSVIASSGELPNPDDVITRQMPRNLVRLVRRPDRTIAAFVDDQELPVEERHGLIWIVDRVGASIDVADWLGPEVDGILAGYGMDKLLTYRAEGFDEPVNWKIMQDAFIDNYHIQYAHPNSAAKHVHTNVQTVEDFGRHARMCSARKSIDRWLTEDPGDRDLSRYVIDGHFLLPNSTLLRQPDDHYELLTFRPHPTDPARCRMEMRLLVPTVEASGMSAEKWERTWERNWAILLQVLHEEDFPLLRGSQTGMASADAAPMVLGRNEVINQIFHREIRKLLA